MSVSRTVTCDSCRKAIHDGHVSLQDSRPRMDWQTESFQFCDLNCVSDWLANRFRQQQGDKLAITYIDAKTLT